MAYKVYCRVCGTMFSSDYKGACTACRDPWITEERRKASITPITKATLTSTSYGDGSSNSYWCICPFTPSGCSCDDNCGWDCGAD